MIGNGTERDNPRKVLADWKDRRVTITGVLENLVENKNSRTPFLVGVFQDVELELPTRARHYLGHLYLQHAETLKGCPLGRRVRCQCAVKPYLKRPKGGSGKAHEDWCLTYPGDIQVLPGPVFLATAQEPPPAPPAPKPPPPAPPPACDPYDAILRVREGVEKAGGVAAVAALLDAVAGVGGADAAAGVIGLADSLGGCEKLKRLLDVLKL
jgi:hypothetical protein